LALFLRLYDLNGKSLWLDEIMSVNRADQGFLMMVHDLIHYSHNAPLHDFLIHFWLIFGKSEFALRLPSVIFGVLSVLALYWLGCALFNRKVALIGSFLLAVNPQQIAYSQETRFYMLFNLLAILSLLSFWNAIKKNAIRNWAIFVLIHVLAAYTSIHLIFILATEFLFLLSWLWLARPFRIENSKNNLFIKFICSAFLVLFLFLPWMVYGQNFSSPSNFEFPNMHRIVVTSLVGSGGGGIFLAYLLWGLFFLGVTVSLVKKQPQILLPLLIVLFLPGIIIAADYSLPYFFAERQLLSVIPFFLIAVAYGLFSFGELPVWRRIRIDHKVKFIIPVLFIILIAWQVTPLIKAYYDYPKEDWRNTSRFLMKNVSSNDVIIAPNISYCIAYYAPELKLQIVDKIRKEDFEEILGDKGSLWFIESPYFADEKARAWVDKENKLDLSVCPFLHTYYIVKDKGKDLFEYAKSFYIPGKCLKYSSLINLYLQRGKVEIAMKLLNNALQTENLDKASRLGLLIRLGRIQLDQGRINESIFSLKQSIKLDSHDQEALNNLGLAYLQAKKWPDAIDVFSRCIKYHPRSYWANLFLGDAYKNLGRYRKAIKAWQKALEIDPNQKQLRQSIEEARRSCHEL
jgi:tetratricopeptide (TPR) repeat protein